MEEAPEIPIRFLKEVAAMRNHIHLKMQDLILRLPLFFKNKIQEILWIFREESHNWRLKIKS